MREITCDCCGSATFEPLSGRDADGVVHCASCLAFLDQEGRDVRPSLQRQIDNIVRCAHLVPAGDTFGLAETLREALDVQLDVVGEKVDRLPDQGGAELRDALAKAQAAVRRLGEKPLHRRKIIDGFTVREDEHDVVAVNLVRARGYADSNPHVKIDVVGLQAIVPARLLEGSDRPYRELLEIAKDAEARMRDVVENLEGK